MTPRISISSTASESRKSGDACVAEYQHAGPWSSVGNGFAFGANFIFVDVLASGTGPAAAIGLSLVIGIVMAEVLRKLGADKVRVKMA
ncbi:hypothetical protein DMI65_05205 [Escherichia coli]|nr:hypothetical protein [Escherichia coli]